MEEPSIVKGVDRLLVRTTAVEPLFQLFTQRLLLPEAWPITTYPLLINGGVQLGNLSLELFQMRSEPRAAPSGPRAWYYGIGLQMEPFSDALQKLDERGIQHSSPIPFFVFDDEGWQVTAWSSIYLGGLLGDSLLARLFFTLSKRAPQAYWEKRSLVARLNRRFGLPFLYNRVFTNGVILSIDQNPIWRKMNAHQSPNPAGLEVKRVAEISVGVRSLPKACARWKALLDPYPEINEADWQLPSGLHIRLYQQPKDQLIGMTLQVQSLNRAAQFLHRCGLLKEQPSGVIAIDPEQVQGLNIVLMQ
ncbi:MAG: hypothetical protein GX491_10505 [Chloroflexi bacterium]|nr:hypothetical protein [Chloroflexota bacterium]